MARTGQIGDHKRIYKALLIILILFVIMFVIGVITYKYWFKMDTVDAIYNTSLSMAATGIDEHKRSNGEKIFVGIFSIISSLFFLSLAGAIIGYIFAMYYEKKD